MSEAPAFQLYAGEFLVDTASWTLAEMGLYCRLLYSEWANGPLPTDKLRLARIGGCEYRMFSKCWQQVSSKFVHTEDGTGLINLRLEETREKQRQYREKQRQKGKRRAEQRWGKTIATAIATAKPTLQPEGSSSSSSSLLPPISPQSSEIAESKNGAIPYSKIRELWIEILPMLPRPHPKNEAWYVQCKARWHEDEKRQDLEWWRKFFTKIGQLPFYLGENDRGWKAQISWVMKREKFYSLLEKRIEQ